MANTPELEIEKKELYKTTLSEIKGTLNPEIFKNPVFEEMFFKEFNFFIFKTQSTNLDVIVAEDKNSLSITSYAPVTDCNPLFVGKNKSFLRTVFFLEDNNLVIEYNQGVLYNRADIESAGDKVRLDYEAKLETNYSSKVFDKDGIQISDNSFVDCYPFDDKPEDIDLRERVMSSFHKPEFKIKGFPKIPIHVINATIRNTYRKYDSLGIIHSNMGIATRDGYKDLLCGLYTCSLDRPELLRGLNRFAQASGKNNAELKFEIVNDYAPDLTKAYEKALKEFKEAMEISNLSEFSKKTYDAMMENINK